jgi:hypothetical protein
MTFKLKNRPQSAVGLSLSNGRLHAVLVARSKGKWEAVKSANATLALDLLHPEPELIGREIRNHLEAAGIRERTCVVAVPPKWVMSLHTILPELPPEDVGSFLQLEAEKGFPCDAAQLQISRSAYRSASVSYVTQLAVRKEQLSQLAAVLKAAGLKPVSIPLGLTALPGVIAPAAEGRITVAVETQGATLAVSIGGGLASFRTCEASIESEAGEKVINGDSVARELRITFEQVPADLRSGLRHLELCGDGELVRQLSERLGDWARAAGLRIEAPASTADRLGEGIALAIATQWLDASAPPIEFLPPRPSRVEAMLARYNSRRMATTGMAVAGVVAVAIAFFGWQEFELLSLRSEWGAMKVQVTDLKSVQDRINGFRPWFDRSAPDLRILARVTQCFPQNGSVTARSFEVHKAAAGTTVSISGTARDGQALLRTQDQLRKAKEIEAVKLDGITGKMPAQFTLTFRWIGNPGS